MAELELSAESLCRSILSGRSSLLLLIIIFQIRFYVCLNLITQPSERAQSYQVLHPIWVGLDLSGTEDAPCFLNQALSEAVTIDRLPFTGLYCLLQVYCNLLSCLVLLLSLRANIMYSPCKYKTLSNYWVISNAVLIIHHF